MAAVWFGMKGAVYVTLSISIPTRPYRTAVSHEEAVVEIKKESYRHFDPKVVEAFLAILRDELNTA
jgi:HD-GYP domain-containing protein (c-di-GMP phosphodiesterase class II)